MDEVLKPDEDMLSTLAAQMGLSNNPAPTPAPEREKRRKAPEPTALSIRLSQLT
jgi:hypothetical protein